MERRYENMYNRTNRYETVEADIELAIMNIPYEQDPNFSNAAFRFRSIWKVVANEAYQVSNSMGFEYPGIFVTYEGKGQFSSSGGTHDLDAGTYIIVPRRLPCSYRCAEGDWKFYFFHFDPMDMASELDLAVGQPAFTANMTEAIRLCERLIDSLILQPIGYAYTAQLAAQELLLLLARERSANGQNRHPELDDILFQMHKHIGQPVPIDDFVRRSGLSRTVFFARFRARTGMSPSRYMQELKLSSAKAALETTNAALKEIASALQFYDEFHFSKLFKQRYGMAPRAYRQSLAQR
ncbi:AraC family transcriptional regulator [Paenibacillus sacheonensis]|uniref:AraC family transcriptional regulator n=1 Tax=Paenibacillus sacheonensis TaxID=742054 RepID=A0A7X4YMI4_9BACL|nr:AraC family transcriptional regulator [Paenibacillus sacheonensis]MBM7563118.1 AraC-like DNA-binding protein [Paenibacillus sacheonensis]NBC68316.1 AraC family transcriptional regulator [Paenibacillus sacheonensis]